MRDWSIATAGAAETETLGRLLGDLLVPPALLLLCGGLGAGKTCFTRGLARGLGLPEDEAVTSPTYTLMNHYVGRCELFHFDLYRLAGPADLDEIGFDETLQGGGVVVVEWSERTGLRDLGGLRVTFLPAGDEDRRLLEFVALEPRYQATIAALATAWSAAGKG